MTLEEIRALAAKGAANKAATVAARSRAPTSQANDPTVTDPLLQHMDSEAVRHAQESLADAAKIDVLPPIVSARVDPEAPGGVPPSELASQADTVDWNPDVAEKMGLEDLATALRSRKGTAQGTERGPITAGNLVDLPMSKAYGRFGSNPGLITQELTYANIAKTMRRMGEHNFFALPKAQQEQITAIASDGARRKVASVIGMQEQRGNLVVDLDPEDTMLKIRRGETAMGLLTGQYVGAKVEGLVRGIDEEDTLYSKVMSPFTAMFVAGGRSVEPQTERPVVGMQKEGKLSWFLRLAPSTAIGSWLFDDDMEWSDWGSEEHVKKIYAEGYDVTQEIPKFGEAYARATPWVDSEIAKKIAGFGMVAPIIFLEPDATAAVMLPVGKAIGAGIKMARPSKLIVNTVLRPELKRWQRLLDEAQGQEGIVDLAKFEASLDLGQHTLRGTMWRAAKGELYARALAEGVPVWDAKSSRDLSYLKQVYEATGKVRSEAGEEFVEAAKTSRGAAKTRDLFEGELASSLDAATGARKAEVDTTRLASAVRALHERREAMSAAIGSVLDGTATDQVRKRAAGLTKAEEVAAIGGLSKRHAAHKQRMKAAQEAGLGNPEEMVRFRRASKAMHQIRAEMVAKLEHLELTVAVDKFSTFHRAVVSATEMAAKAVGRDVADIPGELGAILREASERSVEADKALGDNARAFISATQDVAPTRAGMDDAAIAYFAAKGTDELARNLSPMLKKIFDRYELAAEMSAEALESGATGAKVFGFEGSVFKTFADTGEAVDPIAFQRKLMEKYGAEVVEEAVRMTPDLGPFLGASKLERKNLHILGKLERTAFDIGERGRVAQMAPIQAVLESGARLPNWGRSFSKEAFLASTLKLAHIMTRIMDPILSRGLGAAPAVIKGIYRNTFERFQSYEMEINSTVAEAVARGSNPIEAAVNYMLGINVEGATAAGSRIIANRDTMLPAQKALNYLRAISKAGDDVWENDLAVRSMSWSALASGSRGEVGAAAGIIALRKLVDAPTTNPELFMKTATEAVERAIKAKELKVDAHDVTQRFVLRGAMWAATQHDAMWDLLRAQGGGVSSDAANALNFMTDLNMAKVFGGTPSKEAIDDLFRVTSTYNLPLTQEVLTGISSGITRDFFGGVARKNELMKAADLEGMGVYVPRHIMMAMEEIPRRLTKELEQYGQPTNPLTRGVSKALRTWRISVVNGWILPRPAHFVNTFLGDMSQLVATVGWRPATRISSQTAMAYVPFIGAKLQDRIVRSGTARSILSGFVNPELSSVMRGSARITETADGPLTAKRVLMEGREDGMLDSISTGDLLDVTRRVTRSRWAEILRFDRPLPWIEKSAQYLETIQHRIRMQTYFEARTGKLTGTPLPRAQAAELTREALFDWRLGVPRWEAESVGRLFVFHAYKRNMLRQLGAALTESVTDPGASYLYKALAGRTRLNRMRQTGQLMAAIPETIYWTDPDTTLEEDEQIREFGKRIAPWWVDAEQVLMNREIDGARKAWYSEVAGRNVTTESLILPALTTLDALSFLSMTANTSMATSIMLGESLGMRSNLTNGDIATIWEGAVDNVADSAAPGAGPLMNNLLRPIFGESQRKSVRGTSIPQNTAAALHKLGWGEFVGTFEDKNGKIRYHADPAALQMVGRLVASNPISDELSRNWVSVANPGMQESLTTGIIEGLARITGLVRFSAHSPLESAEWETIGQENKLQSAVKKARSQAGQR